jgi:hypothetical protein
MIIFAGSRDIYNAARGSAPAALATAFNAGTGNLCKSWLTTTLYAKVLQVCTQVDEEWRYRKLHVSGKSVVLLSAPPENVSKEEYVPPMGRS